MDILTAILLLITGVFAGGYGTIVGAGGGFIFVPALLLLLKMEPEVAAGSGLVIVLINAITGVIGYAKQRKIHYPIALTIGISALPGAIVGVWLLHTYSSSYFYMIFATVLVGLGAFLFTKNFSLFESKKTKIVEKQTNFNTHSDYNGFKLSYIPLGLVMGILSSYLGIGGGWLLVPILVYLFKVSPHRAAATSILTLCIYSIVGVIFQIYYQNIDWMVVLYGGVGIMAGANIGILVSQKIPGKIVLQLLSILLMIVGLRMYF